MAVYSMTGFASATPGTGAEGANASAGTAGAVSAAASGGQVTVELRSVNSRFLDLAFRMPDELRGLEPALREAIGAAFRRGKIEVRVATGRDAEGAWPQPQPDQLNRLSRMESGVTSWLPQARPLSVNEVLNWCRQGGSAERLDEPALAAARAAIAGLREARAREGARLVDILSERIARLRELATQAAPLVPAVVQRQQQRFLERWRDALATAGAGSSITAEALQERALNEAAAFAIRIDVAEELSRLSAHLDEISRLLAAGGELGKRLDFLIQELHREANTLGSKSTALELSNISVEMKVAIEQMREQVQNIE
ncbi:YicC/YloC family endoribonuclease [Aquabacterium sp. OR-4]|uniref:YicC/YloC family endoribonuclease n=1 Tax=Aquabacterium sp. OR-4 TaxID=2978127 RepID=UPI0021B2C845|nr:YicC/YloC family endoribonuclease [Aquabacterium sp. OR-4]MDT7835549.1 YicC/YloC family endoribonuclease [Aquabacterium sp. OR-4]